MAITLRAARVNRKLSQREAAKLIGISVDTLSNYERGSRFPDVPVISKIEQVYGVSYADIIFLPTDNGLTVTAAT
jgi:putative transcriptional regulator